MERFFEAKRVAVVGVSDAPENLGRAMIGNLIEFRFMGAVYAVGPKGGSFWGHKIYPSVRDLPERVDLAAVLVPAPAVPEVLQQCGERGVKRVVVESGGFGELGPEGRELERQVRAILNQYGMRMIGPNGLGIMNRRTGLAVPFMPLRAEAPLGRIAVVSQSGGVGVMMINTLAAMNLGFSKFASIGNKLDVNEADLVEYLSQDDETGIVFCYLEGLADGRRLMAIASRSPKPIVVQKANVGRSGAVIAHSHAASLASDDRVVEAAFRQSGIIRTREERETVEVLKTFSLPPMGGNRLAIISRSGGHAVQAADAADAFGFLLPPFPEEVKVRVRSCSRARVIELQNPLDLGDLFDLALYRELAEMTLAREDIDGLVFIHNYQDDLDPEGSHRLIAGLAELLKAGQKPIAICVFTSAQEVRLNQQAVEVPLFTDPTEAVRVLARSRDYRSASPHPLAEVRPTWLERRTGRLDRVARPAGPVSPEQLAGVLAPYGVPLAPWRVTDNEAETVEAAQALGFPVVLKTAAVDVIHKSDAGGVLLNLADEQAVRAAYRALQPLGPRVMVQKMAEAGLEWLVGGRQDPTFGPVVVTGLGGIYVEVFRETVVRVAPIDDEEAGRMVEECRGAALLRGLRGQPALDRQALLRVIVGVSWLLTDYPEITELDLNPLRIFPTGCLALDWRAVKGEG